MFNKPSADYFDPNADYTLNSLVYYREMSTGNYEISQNTIANVGQGQLSYHCDSNSIWIEVEQQEDGTYAVCERRRGDRTSSADIIGGNYPTECEAQQCLLKLGAWLLMYASESFWVFEIYETIDDVREEYQYLADEWDGEDIGELIELLQEAKKFDANIDMASLPSAPIPDDIDTSYPVWAIDHSGNMLVGNDADHTMTIEEYRAELAED